MTYDERLALIRELSAITHVCSEPGCDAEAIHTCQEHPHWHGDETDYSPTGFCAEHFGCGFDGKCQSCLPVMGCRTKSEQSCHDMIMMCSRGMIGALIGALCNRLDEDTDIAADYASVGFKVGDSIEVKYPQRCRVPR
jgi:hypothetical protein